MDNLRIILLLGGAACIFGFFLYQLASSKSQNSLFSPVLHWFKNRFQRDSTGMYDQDSIADVQDDDLSVDDLVALSQMTPQTKHFNVDTGSVGPLSAIEYDVDVSGNDSLVIVLSLIARGDDYFYGADIRDALEQTGFVFGDMNIYHYYVDDSVPSIPLCSVANLLEPGTLEDDQLEGLKTPGLSLFMQIPGPLNGREALDTMLKLGRKLSEQLDADLCDETRSVLSVQTIGHIKEKIEAFHFKQQMANIKHHRH